MKTDREQKMNHKVLISVRQELLCFLFFSDFQKSYFYHNSCKAKSSLIKIFFSLFLMKDFTVLKNLVENRLDYFYLLSFFPFLGGRRKPVCRTIITEILFNPLFKKIKDKNRRQRWEEHSLWAHLPSSARNQQLA